MEVGKTWVSVHCDINIIHGYLAVYLLHRLAGVLHRNQRLLVYVRGFDGVDLLLEHTYLAIRLL